MNIHIQKINFDSARDSGNFFLAPKSNSSLSFFWTSGQDFEHCLLWSKSISSYSRSYGIPFPGNSVAYLQGVQHPSICGWTSKDFSGFSEAPELWKSCSRVGAVQTLRILAFRHELWILNDLGCQYGLRNPLKMVSSCTQLAQVGPQVGLKLAQVGLQLLEPAWSHVEPQVGSSCPRVAWAIL